MASAQPISWPSDFQPGRSHQACQRCPMTIAIPIPELASEYTSLLMSSMGPGISWVMFGFESRSSHQKRSLVVPFGGVQGTKGRSWNVPSMASSEVRYAHPAGTTRDACGSLLYSCSTSCSVCVGFLPQSVIAFLYLIFFASDKETVQLSRFHTKPRYGAVELNGTILDLSQGIPRRSER